jgi:predicted amidophosphoribosyltransferase
MAAHLASHLAVQLAGQLHGQPVLLVPAPSRKSAIAQRGFVPALLLAKAVARQLRKRGIDARHLALLGMNSAVADQTGLNRQQRSQNLDGAMFCKSKPSAKLLNHRMVLIDDVVTTGATLREMNRCLTESGWQPVNFLTFAETL